MVESSSVIICLAYILGLLFTAVPWGGIWVLMLGILAAVLFRAIYIGLRKFAQKREKSINKGKAGANVPLTTPHPRVWLIAGLVGLLATLYFQLRVPQPGEKDISQFVSGEDNSHQEQLVIVRGEVASTPH